MLKRPARQNRVHMPHINKRKPGPRSQPDGPLLTTRLPGVLALVLGTLAASGAPWAQAQAQAQAPAQAQAQAQAAAKFLQKTTSQ
jgi:hypothetical protein